jgi:D-xylose transport system ATP-binding protein
MTEPVLAASGLTKRYGQVTALDGADFDLQPGEVLAVIGDNGAGKSTLIKTIAGINIADHGEIWFEGKHVAVHGPRDPAALGIATVYQDLALCDNLDVVANLYLGREEVAPPARLLSEENMEFRAREVLKTLEVKIPNPRNPVASLSGGQRQSVAVARSVMWKAKIVMLDEPTAALGVQQTRQVLELVLRLKHQGLGVVIISHNLANVFEVADRIIVLRLGKRVGTFNRAEMSEEAVVGAITGAEYGKFKPKE